MGKKLSPKNGIIFIFQYTYDQAKVMAAAWKLSVEVGL